MNTGTLITVSGSVHSKTKAPPTGMPRSAFLARNTGCGHRKPRGSSTISLGWGTSSVDRASRDCRAAATESRGPFAVLSAQTRWHPRHRVAAGMVNFADANESRCAIPASCRAEISPAALSDPHLSPSKADLSRPRHPKRWRLGRWRGNSGAAPRSRLPPLCLSEL